MRPVITVVDDFLPDPDEVRNKIIAEGFRDMPFEGVTYHTVNPTLPDVIPHCLNQLYGCGVHMHVAAFRQGKLDSPLHNLVHADNSCATLAAVLYLNPSPQPGSGTAFWQHRYTGWDQQPTESCLQDANLTIEEFCKDWHDSEAWIMQSLVGAKYNRLVTYPTVKFHSRWPWRGFGYTDDNARLIWAGFFDLL